MTINKGFLRFGQPLLVAADRYLVEHGNKTLVAGYTGRLSGFFSKKLQDYRIDRIFFQQYVLYEAGGVLKTVLKPTRRFRRPPRS